MRALSLMLIFLLAMNLAPTALPADIIRSQIAAMPTGMAIEVRLKNKQRMRGALGLIDGSGFTLIDSDAGNHQIAFADVATVRQFTAKSHLRRNILIISVIGVAALGITVGVMLQCGPLGCGSKL